eukprot:scaffold1482_cov120-Cylindrotheca_fusiformis.AAC.3
MAVADFFHQKWTDKPSFRVRPCERVSRHSASGYLAPRDSERRRVSDHVGCRSKESHHIHTNASIYFGQEQFRSA